MRQALDALVRRPWIGRTTIGVIAVAACLPALQHAFFSADDYRYLRLAAAIVHGEPGALRAAIVVENRWDDAWWIAQGTFVRFFRPLLILFYALDFRLWGLDATGYVATNLALHLAVAFLLHDCLVALIGRGWPALIAAFAFAVRGSAFENLAYVAGRTDTLAALAFVATLRLHLALRATGGVRATCAVAAGYFVALLCKEYTATLPAVLLLLDWEHPWGVRPSAVAFLRRERALLGACTAALLAYLLLRQLAFSPEGAGVAAYPYFFMPDRPGFAARTIATWLQYCQGLSFGAYVMPFLNDPQALYRDASSFELAVAALLVHGLLAFGLLRRGGRTFAVLFVLQALPMLVLYSSARYLYLPALGFCALLGVAVKQAWAWQGRPIARALTLATLAASIVLSAEAEPRVLRFLRGAYQSEYGELADLGRGYSSTLARAGVDLRDPTPLYVLDLPGDWYSAQFARDALAMRNPDPLPPFAVLTLLPRKSRQPPLRATPVDAHTLELDRAGAPIVPHDPRYDFDHSYPPIGGSTRRAGFSVTMIEGDQSAATRVRVRFDLPLDRIRVVSLRTAY